METATQSPERLFDYEVTDSTGNKVGTVDGVWVDDATSQLEFIGVKTGWLLGKTHIIPVANVQIGDGSIQVPYSEDQIKGAPSFSTDTELTPDQEDEIYSYYGLDRSTAPSPTGLAPGTETTGFDTTGTEQGTTAAGTNEDTTGFGATRTDTGDSATVGTAGGHGTGPEAGTIGGDFTGEDAERVRIRKVVRTDHVSQPIDLQREEVQIERVPPSGDQVGDNAFQEQ